MSVPKPKKPDHPKSGKPGVKQDSHSEQELDDALEDSFPASDPVALTETGIARKPARKKGKKDRHPSRDC
jgi:hypothetical protein